MRILIDIDGTIADLHSEWLQRYNTDYDDHLEVSAITEWSIDKFVKPECGTKIYNYLKDEDLYEHVPPVDGALSAVEWFRGHGHDVRFVTSGVQPSKARWLQVHKFIDDDWMFSKLLVIASDKTLIKGDIFIDDKVESCEVFQGTAILFGQPWNTNNWTNVYRATNWIDVIQFLSYTWNRG